MIFSKDCMALLAELPGPTMAHILPKNGARAGRSNPFESTMQIIRMENLSVDCATLELGTTK
jgi:hypothetical protein